MVKKHYGQLKNKRNKTNVLFRIYRKTLNNSRHKSSSICNTAPLFTKSI